MIQTTNQIRMLRKVVAHLLSCTIATAYSPSGDLRTTTLLS
jgi:hypothetical protein